MLPSDCIPLYRNKDQTVGLKYVDNILMLVKSHAMTIQYVFKVLLYSLSTLINWNLRCEPSNMMLNDIISIQLHHVSDHIISHHMTSYHIKDIISYHIISYYVISYHIISYHIMSYHITSYHIISCHIISYHIISYHIISYHIISYHISHTKS